MASSKSRKTTKLSSNFITGIGVGLILLSLYLLVRLFHDPVRQEFNYVLRRTSSTQALLPVNTDFSLVIDKLGATSRIIQDVDPGDSREYQVALKSGIAHAQGTGLPGQGRNIFLFAHSSADLLTAERYNSVFYLMHHLVSGDQIRVWYQGREYNYEVVERLIVNPSQTEYLTSAKTPGGETLTLMTCWPPGTLLKRQLVIAQLVSNQ